MSKNKKAPAKTKGHKHVSTRTSSSNKPSGESQRQQSQSQSFGQKDKARGKRDAHYRLVLAGLEKKLDERLLEKMGDLTKRLDDIEQRDDFHKSAHEAQAVLRDNERALEALKKARLNNLPEFGKVQKRIDELQRRIFARVRYAEETGIAVPRHHPDSVALAEMQELRGEIIAEVHGTVQWLTDEVSILRLEMDEAGYTEYISEGVDSWAKASNKKAEAEKEKNAEAKAASAKAENVRIAIVAATVAKEEAEKISADPNATVRQKRVANLTYGRAKKFANDAASSA